MAAQDKSQHNYRWHFRVHMKMNLSTIYILFLFLIIRSGLCLSGDSLVETLLAETVQLKNEILKLKAGCEEQGKLLWDKIKDLEEDKKNRDLNDKRSKRLLMSLPQYHQKPAFSASLTNHMTNLGNYQTVIFDNVFTNNGNMYSPVTGVFTSPNNGTYYFAATVMSHSGQYLETMISLNGKSLVYMYSKDTSFEQGTNSVVLNLIEGDRVWVRHNGNEGSNVYGGHWSSFSGFQI